MRPEKVNIPPVSQGAKKPVKDEHNMPAHHLRALKDNTNLDDCCRKADDHMVEYFKTPSATDGPDMMVLECTDCGRKHYRVAVSGATAERQ